MQVIALKFLILSLSIESILAIDCYDCNSKFDNRCGNPFEEFSLSRVNCTEKRPHSNITETTATFCRKVYQKVNEEIRIIRSCGFISDTQKKGGCRKSNPSKGVELVTCECYDELCNGSHRIHLNILGAVLILIVSIVSRKLLP